MNYLLSFFILLFGLVSPLSAEAGPEIFVPQPVYDFGAIPQGKKIEHRFTLRNKGDAPLSIKRTSTSCGCTVAEVSSATLSPGKSTDLRVTFDSTNFSGAVVKTVTVESSDPKTPSTVLTLKGSVEEEISFAPRQVNLGTLQPGSEKESSLRIDNKGEQPLQIISVKSSNAKLSAKIVRPSIPSRGSGTILVTVTPTAGDRFINGYLSITTNHPTRPILTIPFYGSVGK